MERPAIPAGADAWARRWGWAVIALAVLLVYGPLSTFTYGLVQGDTLDCWMPWRWFIAQAFQDGHFPLWDPYAQSGYPIYADLQGPAWYLPSIALAGTVGHSLYTLQVLFLAYLVVAGMGLMRLVQGLHKDARIALVAGMAYALSGFFTAHQMHFYAVISGAWLPWLIAAQLKLLERPSWRPAVEAAIFQALLLTGGNHTFTLVGTWLLLALIGVHAVRAWRHGNRPYIVRMFGWQAVFAAAAVLMACGTFFSWREVAPFLSRASGMSYVDAAKNPFTLHAAWSWFFPFAAGTDARWLGTDPTMANGFLGVIVLVLAGLALFRQRSMVENTVAGFGLVCFLASFGDALPVHRALWAVIPGMDLFRFPSYFQWFVALAALVLAAGTLAQWPELMARRSRWVKAVIGGAALLVCAALAWAWAMHAKEPPFGQGTTWYERITGLWRWHRVLVAAPVTLCALIGLWWWAVSPRRRWWALLLLVGLEMGWATTLAQWNTALGDYSPAMLQGRINEMPQGPVWPELRPMGENSDGSATLKYIWRNVQNFEGRPSHAGFNSFWLKDAARLADDHPGLFAAMKRQPLFYLSDSVVSLGQYNPAAVDPARDSALVVLPDGVPLPVGLRNSASVSVAVAGFDHDGITLHVRNAHSTFAVLQQAWYPGWTATLDGQPAEVIRANIACFGTVLPAGEHTLEFRFRKPIIPWLLGFSIAALLGGCFLMVFVGFPVLAHPGLKLGLIAFAGAVCWSLFGHRPKAESLPAEVGVLVQRMKVFTQLPILVNTGRFAALAHQFPEGMATPLRAESRERLEDVQSRVERLGKHPFWWMDAGLPTAPAVRAWVLQHFRVDTVLTAGRSVAVRLVPGSGSMKDSLLHSNLAKVWLNKAVPWTKAFRIRTQVLLAQAPGEWVVRTTYRPMGRSVPMVVVERRRNGTITDYESFPLPAWPADSLHTACVVRNLRELRLADEEVGIYVWNEGPDSVEVETFTVELAHRPLSAW
ncbi:MAG: hypothetical protein JST38_04310 [Bacteroidetes bacterium]|nr:hypothetical protein [Bacteroidota bacterium]MBS1940083.1 hypothetical protein [Bacteroidota bacterium]